MLMPQALSFLDHCSHTHLHGHRTTQVNMCITTDSKASIMAISNWHTWKLGWQAKQEGRGTIKHINTLLLQFSSSGHTVQFQHMCSHIDQHKQTEVVD
jgi:hypothetical protein